MPPASSPAQPTWSLASGWQARYRREGPAGWELLTQQGLDFPRKCQDFSAIGPWEVVTETDGKQVLATFDVVVVCTGHHVESPISLETFQGMNELKDTYLHSQGYKNPEGFLGKKVLVVGQGNSGADIAVQLSQRAEQAFLSTTRGSGVMSRISEHGCPIETMYNTHLTDVTMNTLPFPLFSWMNEKMNQWFNHGNYGLVPQDSWVMQEAVVSDDCLSRILCGGVVVKPNVKEFTGTSAILENGTVEEKVDIVIFTTRHNSSLPLVEESITPGLTV
ncbi:flavin-containing monooxygenase 2-like [Gopherus flavomarginatus]|uniref:flavin-containing monooxygenase 2-like n=1 Tax=Gopherus flavomarginatus TaxID=286002 RepID=UPI0021CC19CE|nr:flavin-containing monooxygenase 2-like [Gopherus flavomarginatus]